MSLSKSDDKASEALRSVSASIGQFSTEFFKILSKNEAEKNIVCSPISLATVLSMAAYGARGNTEKEMSSSLHLPSDKMLGKDGFQKLIDRFNKVAKIEVRFGNKVYVDKGSKLEPEFIDTTKTFFRSISEKLDFNSPEAAKTINDWCAAVTNGRIKDVIDPNDTKNATLILINAVYFKGTWDIPFEPRYTTKRPFFVNKEITKEVLTMTKCWIYNYGKLPELDSEYIEIPYNYVTEDDKMSMFIIRPNEIDGLSKAEGNLDKVDFKQLCKNKYVTNIVIYLPKFKVQANYHLTSILEHMGMEDMFQDSADFSGITRSTPLKIFNVVQSAFIEVNELGTEAVAVTRLRGGGPGGPPPPTFCVDRPFIYAIFDRATNTVLFQGRITLPECA